MERTHNADSKRVVERMHDGYGIMRTEHARGLWYPLFDDGVKQEQKEGALVMIRQQLQRQMDLFLITGAEGRKAGLPLAPSSEALDKSLRNSGWLRDWVNLRALTNYDILPRDVVVVGIMVNGLPFAAAAASQLRAEGHDVEVALLSSSKFANGTFRDGSKVVANKVYIPDSELERLAADTSKGALIVDDVNQSGMTFKVVAEYLQRLGYSKIFLHAGFTYGLDSSKYDHTRIRRRGEPLPRQEA